MGLYQTLENDMKSAMKGGDPLRLSVLRMIVSAVKMLAIEKNIKAAEDADILQIIQRQIKQHKDSIEQFEKGKRQDLAEKESKELKVLESYMPKQLSEEELVAIIKAAIAESGASTKSDLGKVMKLIIDKVRGRSDGKLVNQLVMGLLK